MVNSCWRHTRQPHRNMKTKKMTNSSTSAVTLSSFGLKKLTKKQILRTLWKRRDTQFLLQEKQKELRKEFLASKAQIFVANAHRQFGKSTLAIDVADEYAWKNPGAIIKIGAPTNKQVKDIVKVTMRTVFDKCPVDLRPQFNKADAEFVYPNGSIIKLIGVDINADRLRGTPSDLVILDEVGFMTALDDLVYDIIIPTFVQRPHGKLLMISTPPSVLAHDFSQKFIPMAKKNGAYWELPITKNPMFTKEQIERFSSVYDVVDAAGKVLKPGIKTDAFKREYLCEIVPDTNRLIFPEWQIHKSKDEEGFEVHGLVHDNIEKPEHFKPLIVADWGFKDHTAVAYGWVDWINARLVIKRETFVNYTMASETSEIIKKNVKEIFGNHIADDDVTFYADADLSLLAEIRKYTGFRWQSCNGWVKNNKEGNINGVRELISKSRLFVDTECSNLVLQLDKGVWKENRQDWERSELMGHCDMLAALIYMNKVADWKNNPIPARKPSGDPNEFVSPRHNYREAQKNNTWSNAFGGKK